VRVPLSWLQDFAPFENDVGALTSTLDDLGFVVEGIEAVGEGLGDVVVAHVEDIRAIEGADRIRLVTVDAGGGPLEVVCGAFNFSVGDLVPLAPVGSVLPGGFAIGRRKLKGVTSNGMLCSGSELRLSDDHDGILVLESSANASGPTPGTPLMEALGLQRDVVFDVTVEVNRPDASSIRGVARDLAARLELPFTDQPGLPAVAAAGSDGRTATPSDGPPVDELATVRVEDPDLCPRFVARVLTGVSVSASPGWIARRLTLAGMRPINNVVDASNYVMLELGQPTHPYDLDRLGGAGLIVRRAAPDERITTLDGIERVVGRPARGPGGDTGDCLICDARSQPVGIAGIMGGASSEIAPTTTRVLLEVAYFAPMAIARTSKRLGLRTEASARFEQGCDPAVLERAADRIIELLALSNGTDLTVPTGTIDVRGDVPAPRSLEVRGARVNALLGTDLSGSEMVRLLGPIGIEARSTDDGPDAVLTVTIPTFRPDIRDGLDGEADIAEDVARMYGYTRLPRRTPAWPQPGRLTDAQRDRRQTKEALAGLGLTEVWTPPFLSEADHQAAAVDPPYVEVANPLAESERFLRASMVPGLLRALRFNADRSNTEVSFFEVGATFRPGDGSSDGDGPPVREVQRLSAVFARTDEDALTAMAAWRVLADALRLTGWSVDQQLPTAPDPGVLHPTRSGTLQVMNDAGDGSARKTPVGVVGELHPSVVAGFGLSSTDGHTRRVGWLDLDLDLLLDRGRVPRRSEDARPVSRYPSADMDLALVVDDTVPAGDVETTLERAIGQQCESVDLFDVYRGPAIGDGRRSLAYHLRFAALDHTLTDEEMAEIRDRCLAEVAADHGAALRQ
jgi:phenylalanyl-tRNA synthetase beta chain